MAVTAVWGLTFVQVKDALELYPLFAFSPPVSRSRLSLSHRSPGARCASCPRTRTSEGSSSAFSSPQPSVSRRPGFELTTVASTGFITGLYVVFTPFIALLLFRTTVPRGLWVGVALAVAGLLLLSGVPGGSSAGNALVLASALAAALQIVAMERLAPLYDARVLTFLMMAVAFLVCAVLAVAAGDLEAPRGWTVWSALLVTGIFSGALGYLVATWVQARTTAARAALVFTLEAPFAALFGVLLADEVLGWEGWLGCAVIMAGILVAEPAAAGALRALVRRRGATA